MNEKENAQFSVALLCAILLIFIAADIFTSDRFYSEKEMRLLVSKPVVSMTAVLAGNFQEQYADSVRDQFPGREKLTDIRFALDRLSGKDEENGVYYGDDGYLMEVHRPEDFSAELQQEKTAMLRQFTEEWGADVMLIPTSDNILTDKLPFSAPYFEEADFLNQLKEAIGEEHYIDVYSMLLQHKNEQIFYKTDSHWTSLGAYYGFLAWAQHKKRFAYAYDIEDMTTMSINFMGDLHKRVPMDSSLDEIKIFTETMDEKILVTYDNDRTAASFYSDNYLTGNDQYGYFLDLDHGLAVIKTESVSGRTLILIKGSYGNVFVPLLCRSYSNIYVVDPAHFAADMKEYLARFKMNAGTDILVLYDCIEFLENFLY